MSSAINKDDTTVVSKEGKKYMSVSEMGALLGLKKTDRYYLLHKNIFATKHMAGQTWIETDSFEKWYACQDHYFKVTGEKPGKELRKTSYSVRDIMEILDISEDTARYIIDKNQFNLVQGKYCQRIPKEDFDRWYASQNRYFNAVDRALNECVKESTISMPQMASALNVDRQKVYSILSDKRYKNMFEIKILGEQKRITLKSFYAFLQVQNEYQLRQDKEDPVVANMASKENNLSGRSEKNSIPVYSEYLTKAEASVFAEVTLTMITYWMDHGYFSYRKIGRFIRIPAKEFLTWLGSREGRTV